MGTTYFEPSVSHEGFVTGPNASVNYPPSEGGAPAFVVVHCGRDLRL